MKLFSKQKKDDISSKYVKIDSPTSKKNIHEVKKPHPKHKKHKSFGKKIGSGFKKFGSGVVKRGDAVGTFAGKIYKTQSDAVAGLVNGLSNPIVLITICVVGGIVVYQMSK